MKKFAFRGRDAAGKEISGHLQAEDKQAAVQKIRQRGLWITKITTEEVKEEQVRKFSWRQYWQWHGIMPKQLVLFYRQISVFLAAGLPVHEALRAISNPEAKSRYQKLLQALLNDLLAGKSLSKAMAQYSCFSAVTIQLIRAGEAGGSLEQVFFHLADYQEKIVEAQEKIKSLLLYPAILLATTLLAFIFLTVFILPTFAAMLQNLNATLPLPTRILLELSAILQEHAGIILMLLLAIFAAAACLWQRQAIRLWVDRWQFYLPFWGSLQKSSAWLLVLRTFAILLQNGLPVHQALAFAGAATHHPYLRKQLQRARQQVEEGKTLSAALAQIDLFPPVLQELVRAGEYAGTLETMLTKAADFCAVELAQQAKRLEAMAEPAALLVVGGLVFFFVLSIILPLLGTMDVLG